MSDCTCPTVSACTWAALNAANWVVDSPLTWPVLIFCMAVLERARIWPVVNRFSWAELMLLSKVLPMLAMSAVSMASNAVLLKLLICEADKLDKVLEVNATACAVVNPCSDAVLSAPS